MEYAPPVIPPFRFSIVENGLYRGGYPTLKNFRFLRRLRLSTIVSLVDPGSEASRDLQQFCSREGIQLRTFSVKKFDDKVAIPPELAAEIVSQIINVTQFPLYLHCRDGSHNTGLIIMLLRRLQNWNLRIIYDEFSRFMKTGDLTRDEVVYLESFHPEIIIPHRIPPWLWEGYHVHSHPVMKLFRASAATSMDNSDTESTDGDPANAHGNYAFFRADLSSAALPSATYVNHEALQQHSQAQPQQQNQPETKPETKPQSQPQPQHNQQPQQPQPPPQPQPQTQPQPQPQSQTQTQLQSQPQTPQRPQTPSLIQALTQTQTQAQRQMQPQTQSPTLTQQPTQTQSQTPKHALTPQQIDSAKSPGPNLQSATEVPPKWDDLLRDFNDTASVGELVGLKSSNDNKVELLPESVEAIVVAGGERTVSYERVGPRLSRLASGLALEGLPLFERSRRY